jgi:site-specific DNA-methyltransferase (adenine-specific)
MIHGDCMEIMKQYPDKHFQLSCVDPPYGIGGGSNTKMKSTWDSDIPQKEYFLELCRVSKNQIIWGGNYMSVNIPFPSRHTIIWDKQNGDSFMSDGEIAFTSFDKNTTVFFRLFWMSNMMKANEKPLIHPTQKPVALYKWLLSRYAKPGDRILDTHGGSGSICIACHDLGYDLTWIEKDADYYEAACKRYKDHAAQETLFAPDTLRQPVQAELI